MRIRNIFKKIKPSKKVTLALVTLIAVAVPATAMATIWGPARPTFDYNDPNQAIGSMNGPVFNSFINTPHYGDERDFTTVGPAGTTHWEDSQTVEPGDEVNVRIYVHNNANQSTNASGLGIAHNTRVRFYVPEGISTGFDIGGYVSADNAIPQTVYDTGTFVSANEKFSLSYVPGSAMLYNNGPFTNGVQVSDDVVGPNGAQVGYDALNGEFPGCFEYKAVVIIKLKVEAPKLDFTKEVSVPGTADWKNSMVAKPGETVSWLLDYKNVGSANMDDVTLRDEIPAGTTLVPGSIKWIDENNPGGQTLPDTALSSGGVNVGTYGPNGGGYIGFRTTLNTNFDYTKIDCKITNVGYVRAAGLDELSDDAYVLVDVNGNGRTDDDCKEVVNVSCDSLQAQSLGNRAFRFTLKYTAKNATFKMATYTFGDGSTALVTDKTTVDYTYAKDGTYLAKVVPTFTVDGTDKQVPSKACEVTVSTTTPQTLPNTGAGNVAGIFAATTAAGALAHKFVLNRRRGQ